MPREGEFAEVITGVGILKIGQEVTCIPPKADRPYTLLVITLSDKGAAGLREDKSGPAIVEMLKSIWIRCKRNSFTCGWNKVSFEKELIRLSDQRQINLIFTTGGTDFP